MGTGSIDRTQQTEQIYNRPLTTAQNQGNNSTRELDQYLGNIEHSCPPGFAQSDYAPDQLMCITADQINKFEARLDAANVDGELDRAIQSFVDTIKDATIARHDESRILLSAIGSFDHATAPSVLRIIKEDAGASSVLELLRSQGTNDEYYSIRETVNAILIEGGNILGEPDYSITDGSITNDDDLFEKLENASKAIQETKSNVNTAIINKQDLNFDEMLVDVLDGQRSELFGFSTSESQEIPSLTVTQAPPPPAGFPQDQETNTLNMPDFLRTALNQLRTGAVPMEDGENNVIKDARNAAKEEVRKVNEGGSTIFNGVQNWDLLGLSQRALKNYLELLNDSDLQTNVDKQKELMKLAFMVFSFNRGDRIINNFVSVADGNTNGSSLGLNSDEISNIQDALSGGKTSNYDKVLNLQQRLQGIDERYTQALDNAMSSSGLNTILEPIYDEFFNLEISLNPFKAITTEAYLESLRLATEVIVTNKIQDAASTYGESLSTGRRDTENGTPREVDTAFLLGTARNLNNRLIEPRIQYVRDLAQAGDQALRQNNIRQAGEQWARGGANA